MAGSEGYIQGFWPQAERKVHAICKILLNATYLRQVGSVSPAWLALQSASELFRGKAWCECKLECKSV